MNKITKCSPYAAPNAELICLVPENSIATQKSWRWSSSDDSEKWGTNHWGVGLGTFKASVTGVAEWLDTPTSDESSN